MPTKLHRLFKGRPWARSDIQKKALYDWFVSEAGQGLLAQEEVILSELLPDLFGLHCFVAGVHYPKKALGSCNIVHQFYTQGSSDQTQRATGVYPDQQVFTSLKALPFRSCSVDAAILMHALDLETNIYQAVKEVGRIIVPGGSVVIVGFNPWSLWGVWRLLGWRTHAKAPWCANFISMYRLNDWFRLLDMEVEGYEGACHFPCLPGASWLNALDRLQLASAKWASQFSGVYLLVVKKRPACIAPMRRSWYAQKPRFVTAPMIQTTSCVYPKKNNLGVRVVRNSKP